MRAVVTTLTALLIALAAVRAPVSAAKPFLLDRISIDPDSTSLEKTRITLLFASRLPGNFPVYALTGPQRIVADLANTRARKGIVIPKSTVPAIENIDYTEANFGTEPNTRVEIFLKQNTLYTAQINDKELSITLNFGGEIKKQLPLISAGAADTGRCLRNLNVTATEKSVEVALEFSALPQTASVYQMEGPPRIVMDFYGITIKEQSVKDVKIPPIKSISLVKRSEDSLYTGILINLDRSLPFRYRQIGTRLIVNVSRGGVDPSAMRNMMFIGGGVLLAGGVATGIILGTGQEKSQPQGASDLGAPPPLPGR